MPRTTIVSVTVAARAAVVIALVSSSFVGCGGTVQRQTHTTLSDSVVPEPTEVLLEQREGPEWKQRRREWFESLHRAAPGTDWRALERENRRDQLRRRNRLRTRFGDSGARALSGPPSSPWIEIGSANLAGRTHQVSYDPATDRIFLGSNLGGVWQGDFDADLPDPGQMNWQPIGDSIYGSSLQVLRLDGPPEVLIKTWGDTWTGEVHRSADGGTSWTVVPGIMGRPRRVLKVGDPAETVFLITDDPNHWWSGASTTRLYRSQDLGASFTEIRNLGGYRADIWTSRVANGPLYLLTGNQLEVSSNLGSTWSIVGSLPYTGDSKAALAGSEAGAPGLYAVVERIDGTAARKLFRSPDAGANWSDMGEVTDFWGDFTSFAASSIDVNLVLYGGIEVHRSTDGATSFNTINLWHEYYDDPVGMLHADIPSIDFVPLPGGGEVLFISTDGGAYYSDDGGVTVENISLEGLHVSQYYSVLTNAADPTEIMAGSQDQGFQLGDSNSGVFDQLLSGDYGHLTSSDQTHDLVYSVYPGFILVAEKDGFGDVQLIAPIDFPSGETHDWLPSILADPLNPDTFYFCATHIYEYNRSGNDWIPTQLPHDFETEAGEHVSVMAIAPSDSNRWYAGTNRGRFWYSTDAGQSWTQSSFTSVPAPAWLTGLAILVDDQDSLNVVVAGSGYSNPAAYRSLNGGVSFASIGAGLPLTTIYSLAADPDGDQDLYAGSQAGPYRFNSVSGSWVSLLGLVAPLTTYWDVESLTDRVRYGTYGRGLWDYVPATTSTSSTSTSTTSTSTTSTTLPSVSVCGAAPTSGCLTATKASFQVKDKDAADKDQIKWKLSKVQSFAQSDLGDPANTTTYTVCIYDETADTPALVGSLTIDPNVGWDDNDPKGYKYKDKAGAADGVTGAQIKTSDSDKGKVQIKAKGSTGNWPVPFSASEYFDQDTDVTVQLVNSTTATCWTSEFAANKKNTTALFKAKAP